MNNDNDVAGDARILFSSCKSESHTHKTGFKQLYRRVRASGYKPDKLESKEDFTTDFLRDAAVLVLGCPKERFTASEFEVLKRFVHSGGSLLVLLNEGGEEKAGTNINYLLEEFGISVNNDAVVRTTHYKYLHPKEVSSTHANSHWGTFRKLCLEIGGFTAGLPWIWSALIQGGMCRKQHVYTTWSTAACLSYGRSNTASTSTIGALTF